MLVLVPAPARAADLPNAWQIADTSTASGVLFCTNTLTAAQKTAATNNGWHFTVVSRLVAGSGNASPAQFVTYGNGNRRFAVGWDTNAAGWLTATLYGSPNTTNLLTTAGTAATNYHRHELVYDPATTSATYLFDGASIRTWAGVTPDANYNGQALFGAAASSGQGRMNYHQVQFAISGLGTVSEYHAGFAGSPVVAPSPTNQGWGLTWSAPSTTLTNFPVSPDGVALPDGFTNTPITGLPGADFSSVAWGDYDNDGRLDFPLTGLGAAGTGISQLWRNSFSASNSPPSAPTGLTSVPHGANSVTLSWNPALDAQTPTNGLSYNLVLATNANAVNLASPHADLANGFRRVVRLGAVNDGTNASLSYTFTNLPYAAQYFWSVQALDTAFAGGPFAPAQSFVLPKAILTVTGITASNKAYDGTTAATLNTAAATLVGAFPGDVVTLNTAGAVGTFAAAGPGNNLTVTVSGLTLSGPQAGNYALTQPTTKANISCLQTITVQNTSDSGAGSLRAAIANVCPDRTITFDPALNGQTIALPSGELVIRTNLNILGPGATNLAISGNTSGFGVGGIQNQGYSGTATLAVLTPVCVPPSGTLFPVGANSVTCTAFDRAGNTNTCAFNVTVTAVPAFVASDAGLPGGIRGVSDGAVAWADFDGDGRPDLFLSGETVNQFTRISRLYRNNGGSTLVALTVNPPLPGLHFNTAAWADYDLDGDLDLLLSGDKGDPFTQLYRNDGGVFTAVPTSLPALVSSAAAWGDFDHDGRPDLLLCGSPDGATPQTRLYRNCGDGQFADVGAALPDLVLGAAAWADFDGDGFLDVAGIYRGHGDGTFTEVSGLAYGFEAGAVAWGDFNNDGYPDVVFTGESDTVARTVLYRNDPDGNGGRKFVVVANSRLPDLKESAVAWADFDNDGRLDIVIGGATRLFTPSRQAGIYLNNGAGEFNILPAGVPAVEHARLACADFNGDGRLDVLITGYTGTNRLTRLLLNNTTTQNTAPSAPGGLKVNLTTSGVSLGWNRANDAETPVNGVSYNVRITGPNGRPFVVSPGALSGGARLLAGAGNAGQANQWSLGNLALPTGVYTWGVQAIDSAFAGSAFSTNGTFQIEQPVFTSEGVLGDGRYQLRFTGSNLTYHVEATLDLLDCGLSIWTRLGEPTTTGPRHYEFFDTDAPNHARRFYRLVWP